MKVKLNGAILLKPLTCSAYSLNLPQLPFASCNAVSLVEVCVCPEEIVMSFDFNIGSLSPLFSFQVNSGSCANFSVTVQ